jgi:hypothetical protein
LSLNLLSLSKNIKKNSSKKIGIFG